MNAAAGKKTAPDLAKVLAQMPRNLRRRMFMEIRTQIAADNGCRRRWRDVTDEEVLDYIRRCRDVRRAFKEFMA